MEITPKTPLLPGRVAAVLVTSGNALPALSPGIAPLFAVGDATAARARARGFATVFSAGRDAAALAELVARHVAPAAGPLLLASGAGQGAALAAALRGAGFRVVRRVCYAALPVRAFPEAAAAELRGGEVTGAMFFSAETARAFVRLFPPALCPPLGAVTAAAIGKPAADALKALPWRAVKVAANPTLDGVLALL